MLFYGWSCDCGSCISGKSRAELPSTHATICPPLNPMECGKFHPESFHVTANASSVSTVSLQKPYTGSSRCACLQCGDGLPSLRHFPQDLLQIPPSSRTWKSG